MASGSEDGKDSKKDFFMEKIGKKVNVYSTNSVPLPCAWTLWLSRCEKGCSKSEYMTQLQKVKMVFSTKQFWESYKSMPSPSEMDIQTKVCMMRDDRPPVWEHPQNKDGGCFAARIYKPCTDDVWEQLLVLAISERLSEHFYGNDELCGITLSVKKKVFVVSFWNRNAGAASLSTLREFLVEQIPDLIITDWYYNAHIKHTAYDGREENWRAEFD